MPAGSPAVIATRGNAPVTDDPGSRGAARSASAGPAPARVLAPALAAASPVDLALGVRQFVAEAALQAAAEPRQLRRVEAELLLLGHSDRDGLEDGQKRRAAEGPPAAAVAAEHLGLVSHADLTHLDPRVKLGGELADKLAKIHARVRREVEE